MYVIGGAVNDESRPSHFANYAAEIGEEIGANFQCDQRPPRFCTEDQMNDDVSTGLRQGFLRPFRARRLIGVHPGLAPWAAFSRRFAAARLLRFRAMRGVIAVTPPL